MRYRFAGVVAPLPDVPDRPVVWPPCEAPGEPCDEELAPPWLEERWRTFPPPTVSRVEPELRTAVPLCVRTELRVETPLSTATPVRRLCTTTVLEGSR